ncbi:MAG: hypothetical protein IKJ08_09150 [Alistipes sp.]|nr:hypothetical protein [Alistipes sp.]
MKARFFAIAALVLGLASCQKDFNAEVNSASEVDFKFSVAAPELAMTRAGDAADAQQNAMDSAFGAIDYFQGTDWSQVDLRYTLEVYDYRADGNYADQEPVKDRMAIVLDSYEAATFELRLAPKRDYHFVVFADFVEPSAHTAWSELDKLTKDGLRHRIGDTLASIELIDVVGEELNDEKSDAYFATAKINPSNNTNNMEAIELTRPYAKVRVVATDLHELNLNVKPAKVQVVYDALNANTFNAVEGTISGTYAKNDFTYTYTDPHVYTAGYDAETIETVNGDVRNTHMTLFTDYILAKDEQEAIQFVMTVFDDKGVIIKETNFYTEIPVQRNHLTTIIGNVLTTGTEIEVTINDNFANEDNEYYVFEAFVNGGEVTLDRDYKIGRPLYVKEGVKATLNLNGHSIINTNKTAEYGEGEGIVVYGDLTINGEGTIQGCTRAIWARGNGGNAKVTINGGTYKGCEDGFAEGGCSVIYASGNNVIDIYGGTFEALAADKTSYANKTEGVYAALNVYDNGGMINVYGGKFYKQNPAAPGTEPAAWNAAHPNGFVAAGALLSEDGDWYVVEMVDSAAALQAAIDAGEKYILLFPGEYEETINLKSGVTIEGRDGVVVNCFNINGANNVTLKNIKFDAAGAQASYDKSAKRQTANIVSGTQANNPNIGARNLVIDGCTFTGTFANGGAAMSFADRSRPTGGSGNVTVKNCTFDTKGAYYDIYGYYTGYSGLTFTFENNVFKSETLGSSIYLGRLKTSENIVVKGNSFETKADIAAAVYCQGDSGYSPKIDASSNTFAL